MSPIVQLPDKPTPEWVAVREVAERCGISMQVCRTMLKRERIPVRMFGRTAKIKSDRADAFVDQEGVVEYAGAELMDLSKLPTRQTRGASRQASSNMDRSSGSNSCR